MRRNRLPFLLVLLSLLSTPSFSQGFHDLNWLRRADYTIESADKEVGQIITAMAIMAGYNQTGTRLLLTLIKATDRATTLKVVVSEQKRKKFVAPDPWSDPKPNEQESQKIADQIKAAFSS